MSGPPPLRLAVLGCGRAAVLAGRALRRVPGVSCAYASRDPERAARFARRLGGRAFGSYEAALAAGGKDNGKPGPRPQYSANYYGAFVLDPDGYNVEAVCREAE